jgi:hypothetical protein
VVAFLLVSGVDRNGPRSHPTSAYAAEVIRNADASPLLLVREDGWRVAGLRARYQEGEMQFANPGGQHSELTWIPATLVSLASRLDDRLHSAQLDTTAPVLDTTAQVVQYLGSSPGHLDVTALWQQGELVVEYRTVAPTMAAFEAQLASLRRVDTEAWLAAMPPDVVRPAEFEATVREMLTGVPLPLGFTAADVMTESVPTDRYQLSAGVAGTVSCAWFARWAKARRRHDEAAVKAAVAAMATAGTWPVVRQMASDGAYDQVLTNLATAMPRGSVYKDRPLEYDIESALGCDRLRGIPILGSTSYE